MQPAPIAWAESISKRLNVEGVVVICFDGDQYSVTSYGSTKRKCEALGRWLDGLIERIDSGVVPAPELKK